VLQEQVAGPLVLFGVGGAAADALADRAARLAPLTDADADELIRSIRAAPLLLGPLGVQLAVVVGDQRAQPGCRAGRPRRDCTVPANGLRPARVLVSRRTSRDDGRSSLPARRLQVHATRVSAVRADCPGVPHGTLVPCRVIILPGLIRKCS